MEQHEIKIIGDLRLWPRSLVASSIGVCQRSLRDWEIGGTGPPVVRIGPRPHYEEKALERWLLSRQKILPRQAAPRRNQPAQKTEAAR
jgi:hypothetical protein